MKRNYVSLLLFILCIVMSVSRSSSQPSEIGLFDPQLVDVVPLIYSTTSPQPPAWPRQAHSAAAHAVATESRSTLYYRSRDL